jgi:hypothetical protein
MLVGCGGGVSTPDDVRGTWSDACPTGMLSVDADAIHILYPNKQDFTLTASEFDGHTWKASFENGGKKITDNYVLENGTLWLDTVTVDGSSFSGPKTKMTRCE